MVMWMFAANDPQVDHFSRHVYHVLISRFCNKIMKEVGESIKSIYLSQEVARETLFVHE